MSDNIIDSKLRVAAGAGDLAQVSQLIEQGATVDWRNDEYSSALHAAAEGGHTSVADILLDAGWRLEARTGGLWKPLTCAAAWGHLEITKYLLLRGANIDTKSILGNTPLHEASIQGDTDMVQLLLHCGANQEFRNIDGKTAEEEAENDETRAVFRVFNEKGLKYKDEFLKQAISDQNYDVAMILIFREAIFEGSDNLEKLVLIIKKTSILGEDYVRAIASRGSELPSDYRKCIIMLNIIGYFDLITEAIEDHLFNNIEVKDEFGNTPLHAVAGTNNVWALKCLLTYGASTTQFVKNWTNSVGNFEKQQVYIYTCFD